MGKGDHFDHLGGKNDFQKPENTNSLLFCYRIRAKGLHELNQVQFYANDHLLYLK